MTAAAAEQGNGSLAVHPDRVRAILDVRLCDATVDRLIACRRLHERLATRLESVSGTIASAAPAPDMVDVDADWLLSDPRRAALLAGAALHARALRDVVSGPDVRHLVEVIGAEAHAFGLRRAATSEALPHEGDLAQAIERDGLALLGAWLQDEPAALRRAALLRLPPGSPAEVASADPVLHARAAEIMEAVADHVAASNEDGDPPVAAEPAKDEQAPVAGGGHG